MLAVTKEYIYEPHEFSDFVITYDDARFNVHKYVLARYSEYFSAMLKGDRSMTEIQLPMVRIYHDRRARTHSSFNKWLLAVYDDEIIVAGDFFTKVKDETPSNKKDWGILMDFTQYFGCNKLSDALKAATIAILGMNIKNKSELFFMLIRVEGVKWTTIAEQVIDQIGKNFRNIINASDYYTLYWEQLPTATRDRIVKVAFEHGQLDDNVKRNYKT